MGRPRPSTALVAEAGVILSRIADACARAEAKEGRARSLVGPPSAFTVGCAVADVQRLSVTLQRMHEAECNGDDERCPRCGGDGRRSEKDPAIRAIVGTVCPACEGSGRRPMREREMFWRRRDKREAAVTTLLWTLGVRHVEINRDPRGGPVRVYENEEDRAEGRACLVFPLAGGRR